MKNHNNRISFIIPNISQPRFSKRISEYRNNNKITLFYFKRKNYNTLNEIPDSDFSYDLGCIENSKIYKRLFKLFKLFILLLRNKEKSQIFYAFGLDLLLITVLAKKNNKIWYELGDIRSFKNKYLELIFKIIYKKFLFKRVDLISVTSPGFKRFLVNEYNIPSKKIILKENLLNRTDFPNSKITVKKLPKIFTVGIVGFFRYKSILSFLREYLKTENNKFNICLYGQGPLEEEIKNIILNTNIKYYGEYKYPLDLYHIYNKIHFSYVLYDNFDLNVKLALPNKIYESIFFKTPILVSKNTELCNKVSNEFKIGKCFNPDNQNELIKYLNNENLIHDFNKFSNNFQKISKNKYLL